MGKAICKVEETPRGIRVKYRENDKIFYSSMDWKNFIYIYENDYPMVSHLIQKFSDERETVTDRYGDVYLRIFLRDNTKRNFLRKELEDMGVETFEGDVTANRRFYTFYNEKLNQSYLRKAFYDIETYDMEGFSYDMSGNIKASFPILSIAVKDYSVDTDGREMFFLNKACEQEFFVDYKKKIREFVDKEYEREVLNQKIGNAYYNNEDKELISSLEKEDDILREEVNSLKKYILSKRDEVIHTLTLHEEGMIREFVNYVKEYDLLSAYNGQGFDDIFIRDRCKLHNIDFEALMMINFDYLLSYKRNNITPTKSYKLEDVAYAELKDYSNLDNIDEIKKVDWKDKTKARKLFHLYLLHPEVFKEYNIMDVRLMDMIEKKLNFFKLHEIQCDLAKCSFNDTLYNSRMCDMQMLYHYNKKNMIAKTKPFSDDTKAVFIADDSDNFVNDIIPPGGYTFVFYKGLHDSVMCFDFVSHYLNIMRTFGISPENYLREVRPDLSKVFTENEINYIMYSYNVRKEYIGLDGKLKSKKYEDDIEKARVGKFGGCDTMEKLMWRFTRDYDQKIDIEDFECYTPADMNRDARGWNVHPHYVFSKKERGLYPTILDDLGERRSVVRKRTESLDENSFEYKEDNILQIGLKLMGNSMYGFSLFRGSRFYSYELGTAITSSARYMTKICMMVLWDNNMKITHGDTDSCYCVGDKTKEELDVLFKERINEVIKTFNTQEYKGNNHTIRFDWEKTYKKVIVIKKKRYYYLDEKGKIGGKGGSQTRSDVLEYGAELQRELLEDIFFEKFDKYEWKKKLLDIKAKIHNGRLEEKHLIKTQGLQKDVSEYGKPILDKKTGLQKVTKTGKPMFANIPAHVKLAKKLIEQGEFVVPGDKIPYIVSKDKPIVPITVKEYRVTRMYDRDYYHTAITKPVIEILKVIDEKELYSFFGECWCLTEKQLGNMLKKIEDEEEEEDD